MNVCSYVYSQFSGLIIRHEFLKCVDRYDGDYKVKDFSCWNQFLCMMFGQLTHGESVTYIITCLNANKSAVYHIGIKQVVAVSTLTRSNENRDYRIYSDFAAYLLKITRPLYIKENDFVLELDNTVYAFDSTTIDLCLRTFVWVKFRKTNAAVKMHTLLDLRGNLPTFIYITDGKVHDVNALYVIPFEKNAFYILDREYIDFERLYSINKCSSFFVVRAKDNLKFKCVESRKIDKTSGLRCDQSIRLLTKKTAKEYSQYLRRIKYYDKETNKHLYF